MRYIYIKKRLSRFKRVNLEVGDRVENYQIKKIN